MDIDEASALDPAIAVNPVAVGVLFEATMVDIVDEDDNGFDVVLPPDRVTRIKYKTVLIKESYSLIHDLT